MEQASESSGKKVVVGLGNPTREYAGTRHNVGFMVVDLLAKSPKVSAARSRFQADLAEWFEDGRKVLLVKPETFMNRSGQSVRQLVDFYQLPVRDLLVVCDDFNLPLGKLRARARGTHGGHNGLRNIQDHLGTTEYARLRIGVGSPEGGAAIDHVLGKFRPVERPLIEEAIQIAAQAVAMWTAKGIEACMNEYNS